MCVHCHHHAVATSRHMIVAACRHQLPSVCSVGHGMCVMVGDNSLSRDLFPDDYDCLGDNENRPVKWLAVEALTGKAFSPASDVVRGE